MSDTLRTEEHIQDNVDPSHQANWPMVPLKCELGYPNTDLVSFSLTLLWSILPIRARLHRILPRVEMSSACNICAYLRIFSLTTSRSQKLIPKADFKWECPYFYSKFFFEAFLSVFKKSKMDFPLYFQKVMLLWQGSIVEIDYGFFRVFDPYFIGKSLGAFKILIFELWSFIPHPYHGTHRLRSANRCRWPYSQTMVQHLKWSNVHTPAPAMADTENGWSMIPQALPSISLYDEPDYTWDEPSWPEEIGNEGHITSMEGHMVEGRGEGLRGEVDRKTFSTLLRFAVDYVLLPNFLQIALHIALTTA